MYMHVKETEKLAGHSAVEKTKHRQDMTKDLLSLSFCIILYGHKEEGVC
jgi:hypothetical protein